MDSHGGFGRSGIGSAQNQEIILRIARETSLLVEAGGGIRDMDTVAYYLQNGVSRVVLGSAALENPQLVKRLWNNTAAALPLELMQKTAWSAPGAGCQIPRRIICPLAGKMELAGAGWIVFTDISKDGMMEEPNLSQLSQLRKRVSCRLTASGGIRSLEDLKVLDAANIEAAILGKALYTGAIDLTEAIRWAGVQREG